VILNIAD
jgi:hypothetical protein